jgi:hypothetical protein
MKRILLALAVTALGIAIELPGAAAADRYAVPVAIARPIRPSMGPPVYRVPASAVYAYAPRRGPAVAIVPYGIPYRVTPGIYSLSPLAAFDPGLYTRDPVDRPYRAGSILGGDSRAYRTLSPSDIDDPIVRLDRPESEALPSVERAPVSPAEPEAVPTPEALEDLGPPPGVATGPRLLRLPPFPEGPMEF